jgi:muramoyltetrapeptide carboxypeptidase
MPSRKIQPPFLKTGDEVAIISPSFAVDKSKIESAVSFLENWGLKVHLGINTLRTNGPFAGTDRQRISDIQRVTDNKNIKAVFCARGGYGMLRIIDKIDFSFLKRYPKWYIGFSDVTVLHLWLNIKYNLITIHGEMPVNYSNTAKSDETISSLYEALFGPGPSVQWTGRSLRPGNVTGELTGGNMSLIYSLIGTPADPDTKGKILFIEEAGEYLYRLDRMLVSLKLAGKLKGLAALVAGGFRDMEETSRPWNKTPSDLIKDIVYEYNYPVFFNFPAGHIDDNRSFYSGKEARIEVKGRKAVLSYY